MIISMLYKYLRARWSVFSRSHQFVPSMFYSSRALWAGYNSYNNNSFFVFLDFDILATKQNQTERESSVSLPCNINHPDDIGSTTHQQKLYSPNRASDYLIEDFLRARNTLEISKASRSIH